MNISKYQDTRTIKSDIKIHHPPGSQRRWTWSPLHGFAHSEQPRDLAELPLTLSPEVVQPRPKARPRSQTTTGRRQRKSAILTDTPLKNALEEEQRGRQNRKKNLSHIMYIEWPVGERKTIQRWKEDKSKCEEFIDTGFIS